MTLIDRQPVDRFTSDRRQATVSVMEQIKISIQYIDALKRHDPKGKMRKAIFDFDYIIKDGGDLTDGQVSYLESIYETILSAIAGSSDLKCPKHHDRTNGIRYPKTN